MATIDKLWDITFIFLLEVAFYWWTGRDVIIKYWFDEVAFDQHIFWLIFLSEQ